jgi:hypothetical protein
MIMSHVGNAGESIETMNNFDIESLREIMDRDGVMHIPGLLPQQALDDALAAFNWTMNNPGPGYTEFPGDPGSRQDLSNPAAYEAYSAMLERSPIPKLLKELWGGSPVWFMYEQVFLKEGTPNRTPWHQAWSGSVSIR